MNFKREKPIPSSSVFSNSGLLSLWTGDYFYFFDHPSNFVIKDQISKQGDNQEKNVTTFISPFPSDSIWWESFPSNNCNSRSQNPSEHNSCKRWHQKGGVFHSTKSVSLIFMKESCSVWSHGPRLTWSYSIWFVFDDLIIFIVGY